MWVLSSTEGLSYVTYNVLCGQDDYMGQQMRQTKTETLMWKSILFCF